MGFANRGGDSACGGSAEAVCRGLGGGAEGVDVVEHAAGRSGDVDGGDDLAGAVADGCADGDEADFEFFSGDGTAVASFLVEAVEYVGQRA